MASNLSQALQFVLKLDPSGFASGLQQARTGLASELKNMASAAARESARISQTLAGIKGVESLSVQGEDLKRKLSAVKAEAERLGNGFKSSQVELAKMVGEIENTKKKIAELNAKGRVKTPADTAELARLQSVLARLTPQVAGLREQTNTLGVDFRRASGAVKDTTDKLTATDAAVVKLKADLRSAGVDTSRLTDEQKRLQAALKSTEAKARETGRIQHARDLLGVGSHAQIEREIQRVTAAYERLRASGKLTTSELSQAKQHLLTRVNELRESTNGWGAAILGAREQIAKLALAGAGLGLAIREAVQFEAAMSDVRKVVDFPTSTGFAKLTADIKAMSREIPISLEGLAAIAAAGGQMGIGAKDIRAFTEVVSKMSTAFKLTADEAGTEVGRLMNIFRLTVPETEKLADAINHLGNNSNAVERDIVNVMNRTGAMARVFGLTREETAALSSTFLSLGLGPERSATAINALLRELKTAPQQTDKFKSALIGIGITAEQMAEAIRLNPQKALTDFLATLATLDSQTQMNTLVGLFGDLYSDEVVTLIGALDEYQRQLGLVADGTKYAGSMQREFNERIKTAKAQIELMKNAFSEMAVNLGSAFLPPLVGVVKVLAAMAQGLATLAQTFPEAAMAAATAATVWAGWKAVEILWALLPARVITLVASLGTLTPAVLASSLSMATLASGLTLLHKGLLLIPIAAIAAGRGLVVLATLSKAMLLSPVGIVLAAASAAMYAYGKATESAIPGLREAAEAHRAHRKELNAQIVSLESLKKTLETTKPGTKEHIEAEQKLAEVLPEANIHLDEQGRILARVGGQYDENAKKLKSYINGFKETEQEAFRLELKAQSQAFVKASEAVEEHRQKLKELYGIGAEGEFFKNPVAQWMAELTGSYQANLAKARELNQQWIENRDEFKKMIEAAYQSGTLINEVIEKLDNPDMAPQIRKMYQEIAEEADKSIGKITGANEGLRQFAMALYAPVIAAKEAFISAIKATNEQLAKLDQGINQSRQVLQRAIEDEQKSWQAKQAMAAAGTRQATETIEAGYAKQRLALEKKNLSERALMAATVALAKSEANDKINESWRYANEAMGLVKSEFEAKITHAQRLGIAQARIDEEMLQNKRRIWEQLQATTRTAIDGLIAEERRHLEAVKQLHEQRLGFRQSVEDRLARMAEMTMNSQQIFDSRQARIAQEQALAEEALRQGNFEKARQHAERMMSLAEQNASEFKEGNGIVAESYKQVQKAAELVDKSFENQGKTHQKSAAALAQTRQELEADLAAISTSIQKLDVQINQDHNVIIGVVWQGLDAEIAKLDALLKQKSLTIPILADLKIAEQDLGKITSQVAISGITEPVEKAVSQAKAIFNAFKDSITNWDPEVRAKIETSKAMGAIEGLESKLTEFKEEIKQKLGEIPVLIVPAISEPEVIAQAVKDTVTAQLAVTPVQMPVQPNLVEAGMAIQALRDQTNANPAQLTIQTNADKIEAVLTALARPRTVTLTVVEKHATGGMVGLARGGRLSGYGGGDRIHALLEAGEFVMRKEAVRKYGSALMSRLNSLNLDFPSQSVIHNLAIPSFPLMSGASPEPAYAGVYRVDITANNRPVASLSGNRSGVKALVRELRNLKRGQV